MIDVILTIIPFCIIIVPLLFLRSVKKLEQRERMSSTSRMAKTNNGLKTNNLPKAVFNAKDSHLKTTGNLKGSYTTKNTDYLMMEDRNNDWLAKQLRDESRSREIVSEMFQLKMHHQNNCDAEFIKRFHSSKCDASGIDNGLQ